MKVKLLTGRAGPNFSQAPNEEVDVSKDEAKRLIETGQAEPVKGKQTEKASRKPDEVS